MERNLPEYEAWNNAAISLLQRPAYHNNESLWNLILTNRTKLSDYFAHLGLALIVSEEDGLAYLRPFSEEEQPEGYENTQKLFRKTQLNYNQTILCVLIRERLDEFETEEVQDEYCAFDQDSLFEQWKAFIVEARDDVVLHNKFKQSLVRLEKIGFINRVPGNEKLWRVNAIIKARLSAGKLEKLRTDLEREILRNKTSHRGSCSE